MLSRSSSITSNRLASLVGAATIAAAACTPAAADQATWGPWENLGGPIPHCRNVDSKGKHRLLGVDRQPAGIWLRGDGETWAGWVDLGGTLRAAPECVSRATRSTASLPPPRPKEVSSPTSATTATIGVTWELLGGSVKQKPACLAGPGQEITCLALAAAVAADGSGLWYYLFDGTAWHQPTLLAFPAGVTSTLRPMCTDTARGTACFAVDTTKPLKQLSVIWRDKDGTWGEWEQVAPGVGIAETPHCLASGVKLDCFSRSVNNRLISASFDGRNWSQWLETGSATVQSQPYCNKLGSGFDCYWTSPSPTPQQPSQQNELWHREQQHGVWLAEEDLGGTGTVTARPECLATPGGQRIDCFVQGTDNTLRHRAFD